MFNWKKRKNNIFDLFYICHLKTTNIWWTTSLAGEHYKSLFRVLLTINTLQSSTKNNKLFFYFFFLSIWIYEWMVLVLLILFKYLVFLFQFMFLAAIYIAEREIPYLFMWKVQCGLVLTILFEQSLCHNFWWNLRKSKVT